MIKIIVYLLIEIIILKYVMKMIMMKIFEINYDRVAMAL